jgi:DNA mismatch repair protein MutS
MATRSKIPPGRRQYLETKAQYPDALLLFRMGDFYETFDDDARTMAKVLEIALTQRDVGSGKKSPLAGIPYHSLDAYLGRLVKAGLKVAICEQIGDPAASNGVVDRAVVRIVTPGTVLEPGLLDEGRNNYLASLFVIEGNAGVSYVDITTSQFCTGAMSPDEAVIHLLGIQPSEIVANEEAEDLLLSTLGGDWIIRTAIPGATDYQLAAESLKSHFGSSTLAPYGLDEGGLETLAASAVIDFLSQSQMGALPQITSLSVISSGDTMILDQRAMRDLEVVESAGSRSDGPSLLGVLDRTQTAMGRRRLRSWLTQPLIQLDEITARLDSVDSLYSNTGVRQLVRDSLRRVPDLERLTNRVRNFSATPRDISAIAIGLEQLPILTEALASVARNHEFAIPDSIELTEVIGVIRSSLMDPPPVSAGGGDTIKDGIEPELDEARSLSSGARTRIAAIETDLKRDTSISSLKIGYNKVFGYYVEVSRANLDKIPAEFERRQTLVNAERFITPELKELESKIVTARDRISELEQSAFRRVTNEVLVRGERIMQAAGFIAELDVFAALAQGASRNNWVRPKMGNGTAFDVVGGRHPVVEDALGPGKFVPNDTRLDSAGDQLAIVTGPNMAGKSTYIRQTGLIAIMAQIGSFVPAQSAALGIVDRVFTRCNLTDEISSGRSTFLVEMEETATILHQATRKSLVILDEIGRGTSTYDGLAIARAVAEHIHSSPDLGCKTLFATHYHEMTVLAETLPRALNLQVAVSEDGGNVVFLHKILPGGADRSYGVHVGRLAGLPQSVITRAWELLGQLEANAPKAHGSSNGTGQSQQLQLMPPEDELRDAIKELDPDTLTPLDALTWLYELKKKAKGGS